MIASSADGLARLYNLGAGLPALAYGTWHVRRRQGESPGNDDWSNHDGGGDGGGD